MTEAKESTAKLGVREWIFITSSIVTMLGGIGGTIGHSIFTQNDSELVETKKRITDIEKENQKLWLELSKQGWRVTSLENRQGYDASEDQIRQTRRSNR
jgi:hypothetical protein